jgi:hypothetical protein
MSSVPKKKKMWRRHCKVSHDKSSKNVSNSGRIVGINAYLFKRNTSKVTPLGKL